MILTDHDKNKILIRLASWHNLQYREELCFKESGWSVSIKIGKGAKDHEPIMVDTLIHDAFGHRVDIGAELAMAITRGIRTKIKNEQNGE